MDDECRAEAHELPEAEDTDVGDRIKRVTMFQDSAGGIHPTRKAARVAETKIELLRTLRIDGVCAGGEWDVQMVHNWIIANAGDLWPMLKAIAEAEGGS